MAGLKLKEDFQGLSHAMGVFLLLLLYSPNIMFLGMLLTHGNLIAPFDCYVQTQGAQA